jgi:hypothetical protein
MQHLSQFKVVNWEVQSFLYYDFDTNIIFVLIILKLVLYSSYVYMHSKFSSSGFVVFSM